MQDWKSPIKYDHTPGPWRTVSRAVNDTVAVVPAGNFARSKAENNGGYIICACYGNNMRANQSLIAAAPELFDTLREAIEASGFSVSGPTDIRAAEHGEPIWVCVAREILARATSSEPLPY